MKPTRNEIDNRLVEMANGHSAIRRIEADVKREYRNPAGLAFVLEFSKELERIIESETSFLQKLEKEDGRGNLSIQEMELRRDADNKAWEARIAHKKAHMQQRGILPFKQQGA